MAQAKYLEPPLTEVDMINKLEHHMEFIFVAVITQGVKTLEKLMVLLTKWGNINSTNDPEVSKNKTFTNKNKCEFEKEYKPNTQTFNKPRVATIRADEGNTNKSQKTSNAACPRGVQEKQ